MKKLIFLLFGLLASPLWAEIQVEILNPPKDAWGKQVDNVYRLKLKEAIKTYAALTEKDLGEIDQDLRFLLAVNAEEAKQKPPEGEPKSFILNFDGKQTAAAIKTGPTLLLGATLFATRLDELAKGKASQMPRWLHAGMVVLIGGELMARQNKESVEVTIVRESIGRLRKAKEIPDAARYVVAGGEEKLPDYGNVALAMTLYLRELLGDRLLPAVAAYARQAGRAGFNPEQAFAQCFGRSIAEFAAGYQQWAQQKRNEQYQHKAAVPAESGFAKIDQAERFPLSDERASKALVTYRGERAPKALALSSRGAWAYVSDAADAMERALQNCRRTDPVSCRLYAVDDVVVYQPPMPGQAKVEVLMASLGDDGWTRGVREQYLPLAQSATEALRKLLLEKTGTGLDETVRVHLVSGADDYARVLQDEMGMAEQNANDFSATSGGMANGRGQIAIPLLMGYSAAQLMERSAKTAAHETVHEWQNQQSRRYKGFKVPVWITEGTADLLAYEAIEAAGLPDTKELTKKDWLKKCADWYKRDGTLQAEEILMPNGKEWHQLTSKRRGNYQLAGLMVYRLREISGNQFHKALVQYFALAGQTGQKDEAAFEQSFGLSRAAFLDNYKAWVKTL